MGDKGTLFSEKKTLNLKGNIFSLEKPVVQGILNVTPDSFYDGGCYNSIDFALFQCEKMLNEGAKIIDIGGQSTRPNAEIVSEEEELERVVPVIEKLTEKFPNAVFSIDTFRAKVAEESIQAGAHIINDVSGGELDANMFETVAKLDVPYILMHSRGDSSSMQSLTDYDDILLEIANYFEEKIHQLRKLEVKDIILDPGFGFAKTVEQNYFLLKHLESFKFFELPLLVGVSRKSMIYNHLKITPEKSLNGTTSLNTFALMKGAKILRVHDVKEAVQAIELMNKIDNVSI